MSTQQQKLLKILLIGDSCADKYHYGVCERLSPEAPVPVFKLIKTETKPGMILNVANNLSSFDIKVDLIASPAIQITKERFIDLKSKNHILRLDTGEADEMKPVDTTVITEDMIKKYDAVGVVDYNKGFVSEESIGYISWRCGNVGVPLFIDSKKKNLGIFEHSILKINEAEHKAATSLPHNCELIITCGEKGALYNDVLYETKPVEMHDVCGAGDTFFAALMYKHLLTTNIPESIEFANKCARITVTKTGVYALTSEDIKNVNLC